MSQNLSSAAVVIGALRVGNLSAMRDWIGAASYQKMSMTRKCHNYILQTNSWHCEEES